MVSFLAHERVTHLIVKIDDVDLPNRAVHCIDAHRNRFQARFRATSGVFNIPSPGEQWEVRLKGYQWELTSRLDSVSEATKLQGDHATAPKYLPGDTRVTSKGTIYLEGNVVVEGDLTIQGSMQVKEKAEFDYYAVPTDLTSHEMRYMGTASQTAATSEAVWTIKRFSHTTIATGDNRVSEIQVLEDVAWDDRAALAWS